ncbi:MAG: SOS response-associated peptidase [bacterium]|nr:SOS response-associated peptidase [bacterium]
MCGRFTLTARLEEIAERFEVDGEDVLRLKEEYLPRYNIAPANSVLVVLFDGKRRRLKTLHWGLLPHFKAAGKTAPLLFNARAETLSEKPSFSKLIEKQRCLIVADGFYEFLPVGKTKRPVRYILKEGKLFAFAGLYAVDKDDKAACTIVTTEANELVKKVHPRMPVILEKPGEKQWLDPSIADYESLVPCFTPLDKDKLTAYFADPRVNSTRNEGPELIAPTGDIETLFDTNGH